MPAMVRPSSKARKIAEKIMGKPVNMRPNKKIRPTKIDKRLEFEYTSRIK